MNHLGFLAVWVGLQELLGIAFEILSLHTFAHFTIVAIHFAIAHARISVRRVPSLLQNDTTACLLWLVELEIQLGWLLTLSLNAVIRQLSIVIAWRSRHDHFTYILLR